MTDDTALPTEYRLELSDELNRLGLCLHSGLQQMTPVETFKLKEQFDRRIKLGPKPPTAKQMEHGLAFIGLLYVEALGKAADQRRSLDALVRANLKRTADGGHPTPTRKESNACFVQKAR